MIEMAETTPIEILINLRFQPQGIPETIQALDQVLSRVNQLRQAGVPFTNVASSLGQVRNEATRTAQTMQQASSSGMIFYRSIGALGLIVPMTSQQLNAFEQAVNATALAIKGGEQELEVAKIKTAEFARTMGIAENVAGEWVLACARMKTKAEELGTTIRRIPIGQLEERFRRTRAFMQAFTGALGRFGFTFFRVGYQFYWASIGLLFYVLSLRRARYEQIRMQRTALSLVQNYYRIKEAEEDLRETIEEYGPTSQEARRAARQLAIMRIRQRVAEEQLRASIEQAIVAEKSAFLTLIPIMINFGAVVSNIVAAIWAYISTGILSTGVTNAMAASKMVATASSSQLNVQTAVETEKHVVNTGAIMQETLATKLLTIAKAALISLGPSLIGMFIGWVVAQWQAAEVQREVNRRMAEMQRRMRSMKGEIERLTDSYLSMSGTTKEVVSTSEQLSGLMEELEEKMTGGSVYDSVLAVNSALNILSESLREVRDIRLQYSISIEGIQEARTQIETLEQIPERRTNIEITQEIRQALIPAEISRIPELSQYIRQIIIPARIPEIEEKEQVIRQRLYAVQIPSIQDQVQYIRQEVILAHIPDIQDKIQYIRQELIPVSIPRIEDQRQRILQEVEVQTRVPELIRRDIEVEINVPNRIVKRVDLDIETRIGREFRRTVERPSGNVINLSIGQIQVRSTEEIKDIIQNVYYSLQRNVREIPIA